MAADTKRARRYLPRFSLLTILLVMALVACGITTWKLWQEVGPLRAEVRRLRDEVGELTIDDPTKLHAIEVATDDKLTWKWRVWIPDRCTYAVRVSGENVPEQGFPDYKGSSSIREPGEHVVTFRIVRDRRSGKWFGNLETGSGGVTIGELPWVEWRNLTSSGEGVGKYTSSFDPEQCVVLLRHRVSQAAASSDKIEDPAAGFMIWMEPD